MIPRNSSGGSFTSSQRVLRDSTGSDYTLSKKIPVLPILPSSCDANQTRSAAMAASIMLQNRMDTIAADASKASDIKNLMKRVKDLEEENIKMKAHLRESEDAVKSYRGFLASRNNTNESSRSKTKWDTSTQTQTDSTPNIVNFTSNTICTDDSNINKAAPLEAQIGVYHNQIKILTDNNQMLHNEISKMIQDNNLNNDITQQYMDAVNEKVNVISKLNKEVDSLNNDVAEQKEKLRSLKQSIRTVASTFCALRQDFIDTKTSISNVIKDVFRAKEDREMLITVFGSSVSKSNKINEDKVYILQQEISKLRRDFSSEIAMYSEREKSRNTMDAAAIIAPAGCEACILCKQDSNVAATLLVLHESHRKELADAQAACNEKIADIASILYELQKVHYEEIDSVSKVYHVKDLQKIASMREVTLERDKLSKELKFCNEVIGVLNFSISTAEASLKELQPHVVEKLAETRTKRLKLFEKDFRKQKKDIDQRSSDLCAAHSTHLEQFQIKAAERHVKASTDFKNTLDALRMKMNNDENIYTKKNI